VKQSIANEKVEKDFPKSKENVNWDPEVARKGQDERLSASGYDAVEPDHPLDTEQTWISRQAEQAYLWKYDKLRRIKRRIQNRDPDTGEYLDPS